MVSFGLGWTMVQLVASLGGLLSVQCEVHPLSGRAIHGHRHRSNEERFV